MSAVAINHRKRSEESLYSSNQPPTAQFRRHSPYFQPPKKKRRLSSLAIMSQDPSTNNNNNNKPSSSSRISRYPDAKAPLRREIHAPSRASLLYGGRGRSISKIKPNNDCCEKGKFFAREYDHAKRTALDACRFLNRDELLINLEEEEEEEEEEAVSQDSVIEVIDCDDVEKKKVEVIDCDEEEKNLQTPSLDVKNFGVGETSTMLDSLSLGGEEETADASSLEAYRKLMRSAERRNSKLEALRFEILFNEKRLSQLRNSRPKPVEKPLKKVPHEPFVPLTEEEEAEVYSAFSGRNRRKVLVTHESSNIDITGEVLQCLTPSAWLNDEVINVYLELLKERETREPKNYLKCHFFNTFFYKKLLSDSGYNFKAVRRWTTQKKLGYALIDCDMIFVPIHKGVHWTLGVINNRDRKFLYLDSLNGVDSKILNALAKYLGDEAKEKNGKDIDVSSWEMEFVEGIPQQKNGYDCGMFMLKYIDFFSRGLRLCFSQEHMPYFRLRTAKEILKLRAD